LLVAAGLSDTKSKGQRFAQALSPDRNARDIPLRGRHRTEYRAILNVAIAFGPFFDSERTSAPVDTV
jgi:hypothetical protein